MKKLFLFLLTLLILTSCSSEKKEERSVEINGGVYYGGVFKVNETDNFKSLFPLSVGDVCSYHIANQCYEGLVKFDQATLDVIPAISDRWSSNENHTIWTFHIRENVVFHNDSCFDNEKSRIVTAQDIKYCFDKLCQADPLNSFFEITFKDRVVGANEAFEKSKKTGKAADVVGVKVVNDTTITVELIHPNVEFTNILATAGCFIYPKEALDKYGEKLRTHCVGTGPYYTKTVKEGQIVVLQKNTQYWKKDQFGNQLPYLDAIKVSFINEKNPN